MSTPTLNKAEPQLQRWKWTALRAENPSGTIGEEREELSGVMRALSREHVEQELWRQRLTPQKIDPESASGMNLDVNIQFRKTPKLSALADMVRQMSVMVEAGIPLQEALESARDTTDDVPLRDALATVRTDFGEGLEFSKCLSKHPLVFPPIMIYVLEAANEGGFLSEGLESVANDLEHQVEIQGKIKSALTYPAVLSVLTLVVTFFLITFLVPMFEGLYSDLSDGEAQLPLATRTLVMISDQMMVIAPLFLISATALFFWYRKNKSEPKVRSAVDSAKMKIPVMRDLFRESSVSAFCHNLSSLLRHGVQMDKALDIVSRTVNNYHMEIAIKDVRAGHAEGVAIGQTMLNYPQYFPPFATKMIRTGENTGQIPNMLDAVARGVDRKIKNMTDAMASLIEPLMLVVLGSIVGFILYAMYGPIFSMGELLQS